MKKSVVTEIEMMKKSMGSVTEAIIFKQKELAIKLKHE